MSDEIQLWRVTVQGADGFSFTVFAGSKAVALWRAKAFVAPGANLTVEEA